MSGGLTGADLVAHYEEHRDAAACAVLATMLRHRWRETCRQWPTVAVAAPPVPLAMPAPRRIFEDVWDELVDDWRAGDYRLPQARSTRGLVGPLETIGDCLSPIFSNRHRYWFDPAKPARAGDFVWVHWHAPALQSFIEFQGEDPDWLAKYGGYMRAGRHVIKLLAAWDRDYWLITRGGGGFPLGRNRIMGTLAHVELGD